MISVSIDKDALTVTAEGHAGYAEAGQDIVCAGASMLLDSLAERAMSRGCLWEDSVSEHGYLFLHMAQNEATHWWLDLVVHGLQMLEEQFPENIQVDITG